MPNMFNITLAFNFSLLGTLMFKSHLYPPSLA